MACRVKKGLEEFNVVEIWNVLQITWCVYITDAPSPRPEWMKACQGSQPCIAMRCCFDGSHCICLFTTTSEESPHWHAAVHCFSYPNLVLIQADIAPNCSDLFSHHILMWSYPCCNHIPGVIRSLIWSYHWCDNSTDLIISSLYILANLAD